MKDRSRFRPRRKFGRFLLRLGFVNKEQLDNALNIQKERGGILGQCLLDLGYVHQNQLEEALRRYHMRRRLSVDELSIDRSVLQLLPKEVAWAWHAFPLNQRGDELLVAIPDASVSASIAALSDATGMIVLPVSCPEEEIIRAIERHYGAMEIKKPEWILGSAPFQKFRFESYIVGEANRAVYEAAMIVALDPGMRLNPLFIFGEVGHGKTHLLNAIGNRILQQFGDRHVVYLPAVRFADELLRAVEQNRMKDFKMVYLETDVLLLDDVQFLADQPAVQEEFATLFEAMQARGRQIVVTSDRPPHEVATLTQRVRSRFGDGTIIGIERPNLAMKTAILMEKRRENRWNIPDHVVARVAREFDGDVRRLEGILRTLCARMASDNKIMVDELVSSVLSIVQSEGDTGDFA